MAQRKRSHPKPKQTLVEFLTDFAAKRGPQSLEGAILLLRLDRPIDDLVASAMGLGDYHKGTPSRWSHNVLVTAPFGTKDPKKIPILDCTIRDKNGKVDWKTDFSQVLTKPLDKQGGIYKGWIGEYADDRVYDYGVKYISGLTASQRRDIVAAGKALYAQKYFYDIPGLFRKLVYYLTKIQLPPTNGLLYCSAFCQQAYSDALGVHFQPNIRNEDTTDDDIWYSSVGDSYAPPQTRRRSGMSP
jgi:hypothetical protein